MTKKITKASTKKTVAITTLGAALEWFEFSLYGYLATYLSILFFPDENRTVGLITVFGIFAASYFMRPLGGFVLGSIGDRLGRRYAITLSIGLMCIPMFIMTIMPTYNSFGIWAVVILILARMIQGFSVGGEYTGVLIMLAESAPKQYRGFATALAAMSSQVGTILSAVVVGVLATVFSKAQMLEYGWRVAFLIGFVFALTSMFLQHSVRESPFFEEVKKSKKALKNPLMTALKGPKMPLVWVFVLTGYIGIAYYMMATFLPNNFIATRHLDVSIVMWITVVISVVYAVFSPLFGWFADLWGRKVILNVPIFLLLILAYPMFIWLNYGGIVQILIAESIFALLVAAMTASFQVAISELFPTECRYSGMSAAYNVGNALFAGTTPMISLMLVDASGSHYAPCYYLIITSIITLAVIYKMPETRTSRYFELGENSSK
ncbi:MFS transporter [Cysteiniphilum sp. JM-1]|uniref:MFS transporter n=1 Tax=Cysteiniphilum sp. JM-1 TaxID=2610891 RepID=UPI00124651DD|nr:MFS transporter [Cysteiniphilum sp. JM-1]